MFDRESFKEAFGFDDEKVDEILEMASSPYVEERAPQMTEQQQKEFAEDLYEELDEILPNSGEEVEDIELSPENRIDD